MSESVTRGGTSRSAKIQQTVDQGPQSALTRASSSRTEPQADESKAGSPSEQLLVKVGTSTSISMTGRASELAQQFPSIAPGSQAPVDHEVKCPFVRLMERAHLIGRGKVSILALAKGADKLGLRGLEAFLVATLTSFGQVKHEFNQKGLLASLKFLGYVDIDRLQDADGVAHDDLFSTDLYTTLKDLKAIADTQDGKLYAHDLADKKSTIAAALRMSVGNASQTENKLPYVLLGGLKNGYIQYTDLERFLAYTELPENMADTNITKSDLDAVK